MKRERDVQVSKISATIIIVSSDSDDDADVDAQTTAEVNKLFSLSADDDDNMQTLEKLNATCQAERKNTKATMVLKKVQTAKDREIKVTKAAQAKAAKETAKAEAASKTRTKAKSKTKAKPKTKAVKETANPATSLTVGMKISGQWREEGPEQGSWYPGKVVSIDFVNKTIHCLFDDGDVDTALPWDNVIIPEVVHG